MANMTIRNVPDEVHDHLRVQAVSNKRSVEAEVRAILVHSYIATQGGGFGQQLRRRFENMGVLGHDLHAKRDQAPGEAAQFE